MKSPQTYKRTFRRPRKGEEVEWDISQDQIDVMVEEFLANKKKEEAKNPPKKVEIQPRRVYSFNGGGRGRPRKNLTKLITMIKCKDGLLKRADRGRPLSGEIRVKMEVPYDFVVMRTPIFYKIDKSGVLTKTAAPVKLTYAQA